MTGVIERLLGEHRNLDGLVRLLDRQPSLMADPGAANISLLVDAVFYLTRFPDVSHHALEDRIAERLRTIGALDDEYVDEIELQHARLARQGRDLLQDLESAARNETMSRELLAANVRLYGERLRNNMAVEELTLFPAALRSLVEADWQAIGPLSANPPPDPLFRTPVEARFEQLQHEIAREADRMRAP